MNQTDIPEFIDTPNLNALLRIQPVRLQRETLVDLTTLARAMQRFGYFGDDKRDPRKAEADAARYAIEVGLAALASVIEAEERQGAER